jgi:hypothetical protein
MNWINPHVLLGLGAVDSTRITLLDSTGARILVGPARLLGPDSIPIQTRLSVSSGVKACSRPGGREWAMIFLAAGRIDRYNDAAQLLGQFEVPIATDGYFVRDSSGAWSAPIPRLHYVDCAATNNKLYAVYSGRTREAFEGAGASNGRYLHVFSWSGKLERSFRFDDEVGYIAMEGDSIIYATAHNSTAVRRFTLPQH